MCTVAVMCFTSLNAVVAGGFVKLINCDHESWGPMRRIVQIPFGEFYGTIRVYPRGAYSFSVGPSGPILTSTLEFLTPWDPSGSPGEPWGGIGTIKGFKVLTFELFFFC